MALHLLKQKSVKQEQKDDSGEATASTPKNIRIEANGADVVFELNENGYNISINANSNNQEVKADTPVTSSTNWYEVLKIGLLAANVFAAKAYSTKEILNSIQSMDGEYTIPTKNNVANT